MKILTDSSAGEIDNIPLPYQPPVRFLLSDLPENSSVIFIEVNDQPPELSKQICRNIDSCLEGVSRQQNCLIGVVIYGNSGDGVSIICPDIAGYADAIRQILINHLPEVEST